MFLVKRYDRLQNQFLYPTFHGNEEEAIKLAKILCAYSEDMYATVSKIQFDFYGKISESIIFNDKNYSAAGEYDSSTFTES